MPTQRPHGPTGVSSCVDRASLAPRAVLVLLLGIAHTACSGATPLPHELAVRRLLPDAADPEAIRPLLDCEGSDRPLCPPRGGDWTQTRAWCEALASAEETAFTGHRCLAHLEMMLSQSLVVVDTKPGDTMPSEALAEDFELQHRVHEVEHLTMARRHLDAAIAIAPDAIDLFVHRVAIDARLHDEEALRVDLATAAADPRQSVAWRLHGVALAAVGGNDNGRAIRLLQALVARRPDFGPAWADLGALVLLTGDLEQAREHLERALQLAPTDPAAYASRAQVALLAGDLTEALQVAQRASTSLDGHLVHEVLYALRAIEAAQTAPLDADRPATILTGDEAPELAGIVRDILALPPGDAAAWGALALQWASTRDDTALAVALAAQRADAGELSAVLAQAEVLGRRALFDARAEVLNTLLSSVERGRELHGGSTDALRLFGVDAYVDAARYAEARQLLERVEVHDTVYHYLDGVVAAREGRVDAAREALRQVIDASDAGSLREAARRELDALSAAPPVTL